MESRPVALSVCPCGKASHKTHLKHALFVLLASLGSRWLLQKEGLAIRQGTRGYISLCCFNLISIEWVRKGYNAAKARIRVRREEQYYLEEGYWI